IARSLYVVVRLYTTNRGGEVKIICQSVSAARRSLLVDCYSPLPAPETTLKLNNQAPRIKCLPRQRERLSHTRLIHAILLMLPRRRDQFNGSAQRNAISDEVGEDQSGTERGACGCRGGEDAGA